MAKGTEAEYASAAHLLKRVALLKDYLNDADLSIDWDGVLAREPMVSDGERVLLHTALALFTGQRQEHDGPTNWIHWLDDGNFRAVLEAVAMRKGIELAVDSNA